MRTTGSARNVVAQALRIDLSPGLPPSPCTAVPGRGGLLPADSREQAFMRRTCLVTAIMGRGPPTGTVNKAEADFDPRSRGASALSMRRREMLRERQVAAPLMAQRAAHGALGPAHRRFQPGAGVGVQLAGLGLSGKRHRPSPCQFGHQTLVLAFALIAPAASRPGQHCAVRRQRGRQVAPCGHLSTVGQRSHHLVTLGIGTAGHGVKAGSGQAEMDPQAELDPLGRRPGLFPPPGRRGAGDGGQRPAAG